MLLLSCNDILSRLVLESLLLCSALSWVVLVNRFWKTCISRASCLIYLVHFSSGGFANHLCQYYQMGTILEEVQFRGIIKAIHYLLKRCIWTVRDTYSIVCWGVLLLLGILTQLYVGVYYYLKFHSIIFDVICINFRGGKGCEIPGWKGFVGLRIALLLNVLLHHINIQCLYFSRYNTWTTFFKKMQVLLEFSQPSLSLGQTEKILDSP